MRTVYKRKVLIIGSLPPPYHGCNVFIQQLLNSKLNEKFRIVHLDTSDRRSIDNIAIFDFMNAYLALKHLIQLIILCLRYRPDIGYLGISQGNLGYLRDGLFILIIAFFSKAKIVIQLHGSYFKKFYESTNWIMRRLINLSMRCVSRAIVLGESLKPIFRHWLPDSQIDAVPNGSPLLPELNGKFNRTGRQKIQIIYLGNLLKFKGVLDIVDAAEHVLKKHPQAQFRFAGNWGYDPVFNMSAENMRKECQARIQNIGASDNFVFVGELKDQALEDFLVDGDIFVFPSIVEGMPLVILEAMAAGNAIISTKDVGAIPEIVKNGETGLLVEKNNSPAIANAIIDLIENPQLRHRMGQAGRHRFEKHYTIKKNIENIITVFQKSLTD